MSYVLGMCKNAHRDLAKVSFMNIQFWPKLECQQTLAELPNIKFHENSFSGSQAVTNGQACQKE
jgi:hypothetical protein